MQSQREDVWWAGVVVIGGVSGVLSLCCLHSPSIPTGYLVRAKSILLGCPPHLQQQTGAKGTLVSDLFFSSFVFGSGDLCVVQHINCPCMKHVWFKIHLPFVHS